MNDEAKQHVFSALIIILLIICIFSSIYNFPVDNVESIASSYIVFSGSNIDMKIAAQRKLVRQSNGTLYCTFEENNDIHIAWSENGGVTWTDYEVYGAQTSLIPSLAVDSNDIVHLVFYSNKNDADDFQLEYSNSSDWTTIVQIRDEDKHHTFPSIAVDSNDNLHVVYEKGEEGTSNDNQVAYINSTNNGGSWGTEKILTDEADFVDDAWVPSIAIDNNDIIHVVFSGEDHFSGLDDILHVQSSDNGGTWSNWEVDPIYQDGTYNQNSVCLVIDNDDVLHVIWTGLGQNVNDQIGYSWNDSSGWTDVEWVTWDATVDNRNPSISVNDNDYIHAAIEVAGTFLNHSVNDTISWTNDTALLGNYDYPNMISTQHPTIGGIKTNQPKTGYAFISAFGTSRVVYHASDDLLWGGLAIQTNASTSVEETNATLDSYLVDDAGENCKMWFEYGFTASYGNDTRSNITYTFVNTTVSTTVYGGPTLIFDSYYWTQNTTIATDNTIEIFLNASGIYDDIDWIFRAPDFTNWNKGAGGNTLKNITYDEIYIFLMENDTANLSLSWDSTINYNSGDELSHNLYTRAGTLYHYRAVANDSNTIAYGSDEVFLTKPVAPDDLVVDGDYSPTVLNLSWTNGTGVNNTYIERNTVSSWSRGEGTLVYNGTNPYYNDTGLTRNALYYYQAWSFTNWTYNPTLFQWSDDYDSNSNTTNDIYPPYDGTSSYIYPDLNLTWTRGNNSDKEIVVQNNASYPTSPTDGWVRQNGTNTYVNLSITYITYFTVWSYNDTSKLYSLTGLDIPWGGLTINCYDEETNESLEFDIEITNQDGTETYQSRNNSNSLVLDVSQLPLGDQIKIIVSAAQNYTDKNESFIGYPLDENYTITYIVLGYIPESKQTTNVTCRNSGSGQNSYPAFTLVDDLITILPDAADEFDNITVTYEHGEYGSRTYYRDLDESSFYLLNTYLPPSIDKELYLLEVIDEAGNTVEDAFIEIKRNINGTYVIVSSLYTDANGQVNVELIPERNYIFIISKDGYVTENASWQPSSLIFTHTFKIIWEIAPFEPDTFGDIISFYGTLYENNTMMIMFYDLDNSMIDSHFTIYENYDGTLTYMGEYNGTTSNDIIFWIDVDNATRSHIIILYMNHTTLGQVINHRIVVYPVHIDRDEGNWLENLIRSVVGDFDYGYVITFMWYLPCVLLIAGMAAIGHPGMGILGSGLYSMWITWYLFIPEEDKILIFASIAIVTGFITFFLVKGKKKVHQ